MEHDSWDMYIQFLSFIDKIWFLYWFGFYKYLWYTSGTNDLCWSVELLHNGEHLGSLILTRYFDLVATNHDIFLGKPNLSVEFKDVDGHDFTEVLSYPGYFQ